MEMACVTSSFSTEDVQKVAKLARLKLSDEEVRALAEQMGQVLSYVEVLNELNTDEVEPLSNAVEVTNILRADEVADSLPREAALSNAPKTDGKYFLVPQILDGA